jgi:hypothetical protein
MSPLPDLQIIARLLAELGLAGDALADAAGTGDVIGALAASHETRRLRAELARHPIPDTADEAEVTALQTLVARGRAATDIADRWRARTLPPVAELVTTPLGVACLADDLLPPTWDVTRDLVVLIGAGLEGVAAMLSDLGQNRILVVHDGPAPAGEHVASYQRSAPGATIVSDATEVGHAVRTMFPVTPERVVLRSLAGNDPERDHAIADVVHDALSDLRVHQNTVQAFSRTWLAQGAANLEALARCPTVAAVGDGFAGKPMIICAPGPSLAGNVEQLRAMKGKAIIVAFSHSLRPLRAAGVVPDLVVTVDPQDVRYHFSPGDLDGVAAMVNGCTVFPTLFEMGAKRHLSMASNGLLDRWLFTGLGDVPEVPGGGSVATTALSLGLRWKCDPIVMVGLDLSFPGGKYYVDTSCDGGAHAVVEDGRVRVAGWSDGFQKMKAGGGPQAPRERLVELPGWHGGTVPSSFMFAMFHRWFVETARRVATNGGARIFNCTEGGSYIDGMSHAPLAGVLATLTDPVDIDGVLDRAMATIEPDTRALATRRWRQRTVNELRQAARLATIGINLCRRSDASVRLQGVERELAKLLARHNFVAMLAQREIDAALDEARRPASEAEYLAATRALLEAAARTSALVSDILARPREGGGKEHG